MPVSLCFIHSIGHIFNTLVEASLGVVKPQLCILDFENLRQLYTKKQVLTRETRN